MPVSDFSFTFLGTGTSAGIPVITCDCDVCKSDNPKDKRLRCSVCVRFKDDTGQDRVVLIDTSPDLRQQVLREKLTRCDAILFTHNHVDHTFGLDDTRMFNISMSQPLDIYAERHTLDHLSRVFQHVFESHKNVNDSFVANLVPHEIYPDEPIDLFGVTFTPVRLLHGRLPIVGFRLDAPTNHWGLTPGSDPKTTCHKIGDIGSKTRVDTPGGLTPGSDPNESVTSIAYCTDVSSIPPESWSQLENLDVLVLDMLRFRHHPTHLNLDQAIEIAQQVGAKQTYFTHMTHCVMHDKTELDLPKTMHLAYDGLSF